MSSFRTLRFRLMVWNACVVILTAVTTLVIVREGVRYSLLSEMDQVLGEDLSEIGLAVRESPQTGLESLREPLNRKARGHLQHGWFVRLMEGPSIVWASENTPETLDQEQSKGAFPWTTNGYRLVGETFRTSGGAPVSVQVGASLEFLGRDMERIDRLTALGVGIVFIAAPLGGYWLAGRATRPIGTIIRTADRLRPAELTERLPLRNTGDELDRLSLTINGLLDRIAEYIRQRRDFIANAAHELRTPLAAIRSSVEVALNSHRSQSEYEELLSEMIDESTSLETLVNQLLLLAESDSDRLRVRGERTSLSEVAEQSAEMFRAVAESRAIELITDVAPSVTVEGNRHHLRQVVNNLIDNAIKFTPAGGRIMVRLEPQPGERVSLTVSDTGCGIPPDDLPHVFERFYRGDKSRSRDGQTSGTGLGLSICRALIAAHQGEISVESTGVGTTFRVVMPVALGAVH